MQLGHMHSYVINYTTNKGEQKAFLGTPFVINAALHQEDNGLFISFNSGTIFDFEQPKIEFSEEGSKLMIESSDIMKDYFYMPFVVRGYAHTEEEGERYATAVAKKLAQLLVISPERIRVEGYEDIPENFHIDIVIQNRKESLDN
jgi:hypothetical protein